MIFYKQLSIKKTTLIIFIAMYLLFFCITTINLYSYSSYEYSKTEKLINNFNTSLSQQITEKLDSISDVSKYPLLIPEISRLHTILISNSDYQIEDYNYLKYLCKMMIIQNDSINGSFIYSLNGDGVYTSRNLFNDQLINVSFEEWFHTAINSPDIVTIIPHINTSNLFVDSSPNNEDLIGISRKIIDTNTQKLTGIILVTIPTEDFLDVLSKDIPFNNEILSIYTDNNKILSSTSYNDFIPSSHYIENSKLNPTIDYIDDKLLICYNTIESTNWTLINTIPKSEVFNISNLYLVSFLSSILLCLFLFIVLYLLFIKRILHPINSLIVNMDTNVESSLTNEVKYNSNDEIGILIKSYNEMKSRINDLININYKNQIEQKELELNQLQTQINPHFIYNTLESIHMMAEINDDLETSSMAENFGSIIRYSMNRKINTVSLKEELAIIDSYIYLQKIRFDQLFSIEILADSEVLDCEIIKMVIQPLIENAIYHGLSECTGNGKIIIQGQKINDILAITISDNGIGIDEASLKDLNEYINDGNSKFKGIALRNINRRLKLNYGEEYGLEILSILGIGTSMILTLPFILKNSSTQ